MSCGRLRSIIIQHFEPKWVGIIGIKYIETDRMKVIKIDSSSETRDRNTRDKN